MITYHVSPTGNDAWSGVRSDPTANEGPFATLGRAQKAARAHAGRDAVTVVLHPGDYALDQTLAFTKEDSGAESAPMRYRAVEPGAVRLLGGRTLSGFAPVSDSQILSRLPEGARTHVRSCDLRAHGIADIGRLAPRGFSRPQYPAHLELFINHQRQQLARWPNGECLHIKAPAQNIPEGDAHGGLLGDLEAGFFIDTDRPKNWRDIPNAWMHGYWAWDWAPSYERIAAYDPQTGHIRTEPPHGLYGIKANQRIYFLNILEELDSPGEYFVDAETQMLYFWPPENCDGSELAVSVLETPLITVTDARHIAFENLTLEYTRGDGLVITGGSHIRLSGCAVRNVGNAGIAIDGGENHTVQSCDIDRTGETGVRVSGGNRQTLTRCNHQVDNCHIHTMAEWVRTYQPGIKVSGVGIRISHNHIHHGPHNAILLSGNEHLIEYNRIHHVCLETGDVGAFYMGRDWTERGIRIQYNYFHDLGGYGMGSMGIYMDDCASGGVILGNLFVRCTRAVFIGGGRNHRVENNVFVHCRPAIQIDGRGLDARPVWHNMVYSIMKPSFESMNPLEPPYRTRYPELREVAVYYQADTGVPPEGNLVVRNISWQSEWLKIHWNATPKMVAIQRNLVDEDPLFVNASADDYRLRENSPALELGIKPLPLDQIGLYEDSYRSKCVSASGHQL